MPRRAVHELSRRERQVMEIVYRLGQAAVSDVVGRLADRPSYSAVRGLLRVLEDKGHLRHRQDGPRYVYSPTTPRSTAKRSALRHVLRTFFDDSVEGAVSALIEMERDGLTDEQLRRMSRMIARAREEGDR